MDSFWRPLFDNDHPVEIEIGAGTGAFLAAAARAHPDVNYMAIEHSHSRAMHLEALARGTATSPGPRPAAPLTNVVALHADAACVISCLLPEQTVSAYHIYFPDPWWKRRHHRRRLFTAEFVGHLARTLASGGKLYVATDVPLVIELIFNTLKTEPRLQHAPGLHSSRAGYTRFEEKGLQRGATIYDAVFIRAGNARAMSPDDGGCAEPRSTLTEQRR